MRKGGPRQLASPPRSLQSWAGYARVGTCNQLSSLAPGAGGINGVESPFFLAFLDPEGQGPEDTGTVGAVYFAHPELQVWLADWLAVGESKRCGIA